MPAGIRRIGGGPAQGEVCDCGSWSKRKTG
jgi:hypothetical protein